MLSEKFNRQFAATGFAVVGLLLMLHIPKAALRLDPTFGLMCAVGGVGLWIWTTYNWTATRPAVSRRIAIWRLVGTALWIASVFLTSLAANSLLALAAMFAIMIITIPITLAERDRRLAGWERHVLAAICVGGGLVFLLRIPLRFVAYVMGVPMQEVASSPSIASSLWIDTTFGGVFLVFGIAFWVWATRQRQRLFGEVASERVADIH